MPTTEPTRYVDFDAAKRERDNTPIMLRFAGETFALRAGELDVGAIEGMVLLARANTHNEWVDAMRLVTGSLCADASTEATLWAAMRRERVGITDGFKLADQMCEAVIALPLEPSPSSPPSSSSNGQRSKADSSPDADPARAVDG